MYNGTTWDILDIGHTKYVSYMCILNNTLITGSRDKTLRIYNLTDKKCERVLIGHSLEVTCIEKLSDDKIISGSNDGTMRIWDLISKECEELRDPHYTGSIRSIVIHKDLIISATFDNKIQIWKANKIIKSIYVEGLFYLQGFNENSGSFNGSIKIWNTQGEMKNTLMGSSGSITCIQILRQKIYSSSEDGIRVWYEGQCKYHLNKHTDRVNCFKILPDGRFVSGSEDGTIIIWA